MELRSIQVFVNIYLFLNSIPLLLYYLFNFTTDQLFSICMLSFFILHNFCCCYILHHKTLVFPLFFVSIISILIRPHDIISYYNVLCYFWKVIDFKLSNFYKKKELYVENTLQHVFDECIQCDIEDDNECFICLETEKETPGLKRLPCSHPFHFHCLLTWYTTSNLSATEKLKCPVCRRYLVQDSNC